MNTTHRPKAVARSLRSVLNLVSRWAALGVLALGAACSLPEAQPDLTRYYVLTSEAVAPGETVPREGLPRVWVRAVGAPEYLRGRIMQVRVSDNELRFVDNARWAEPLEGGMLRVIRENLARNPGVRAVSTSGDERDFDVAVQLRRCEGVLSGGGAARLHARIEIFSTGNDPRLVRLDDFTAEIPGWDGTNHADLAKKLSEAAANLSQRIAELVSAAK